MEDAGVFFFSKSAFGGSAADLVDQLAFAMLDHAHVKVGERPVDAVHDPLQDFFLGLLDGNKSAWWLDTVGRVGDLGRCLSRHQSHKC